ncbi:MAG: sulfite exporter TauE/SafE family protein [Lachnospiraceae bacterium]
MSSFLGIGGGPINLVVLLYFFSMDTKAAAQNSLYIILFSSDHQLFTDGSDRKSASFPDHGSGDHGIWRTDGRLLWTNY